MPKAEFIIDPFEPMPEKRIYHETYYAACTNKKSNLFGLIVYDLRLGRLNKKTKTIQNCSRLMKNFSLPPKEPGPRFLSVSRGA